MKNKRRFASKTRRSVRFSKKLLCIPFIFILLAACLIFFLQQKKYISGHEWYEMQDKYMNSFETLADDMDNAVSLYVSGSINKTDFQNYTAITQKELNILKAEYDDYSKEHPVRTGTYTYNEKTAVIAVESLFGVFQHMLDMMQEKTNMPDELAYEYIGYHQDVIYYVSRYVTAQNFINGKFTDIAPS